nr:cytochrome b [Stylonema alsidii]
MLRQHAWAYPSPNNLTYSWNFGFLALLTLSLQLLTGILLAMHYIPQASLAFTSIEHILRDVNHGWLLRYAHANTASAFFLTLYLHTFRGLYYGSYSSPRHWTWLTGILLLLTTIITAFIGYVLPWGQMSLWGATVITNLASAIPLIGPTIVNWLWGGYSVDHATLLRFFSLHYLLPFIILGLSLLHIALLHTTGSSSPLGLPSNSDQIALLPYFLVKDLIGLTFYLILLISLVTHASEALGHSDNSIPANPMVTPLHIVPEWYFLPYYAILRSIPHKLLGVIAMLASILLLAVLPWLTTKPISSNHFLPGSSLNYYLWISCFLLLGFLGAMPVEPPYVLLGQLATLYYFLHLLIILPLTYSLEASLTYKPLNTTS